MNNRKRPSLLGFKCPIILCQIGSLILREQNILDFDSTPNQLKHTQLSCVDLHHLLTRTHLRHYLTSCLVVQLPKKKSAASTSCDHHYSKLVCLLQKKKKKEDCVSAYPSVPYLRRPALTMPMGVNYKINIHGQRMHHLGVSICICRSISWCNDDECTQR